MKVWILEEESNSNGPGGEANQWIDSVYATEADANEAMIDAITNAIEEGTSVYAAGRCEFCEAIIKETPDAWVTLAGDDPVCPKNDKAEHDPGESEPDADWDRDFHVTAHDVIEPPAAAPEVIHTSCKYCQLDIEGIAPFAPGLWRDRGNNARCNDGKHAHTPYLELPAGPASLEVS